MSELRNLLGFGELAPSFKAAALDGSPVYSFDTVAGRHVLMLFFGSGLLEPSAKALSVVQENRVLFDDQNACFFGVTIDPKDAAAGRIRQQLPGIRYFLDYEREVSPLFGAVAGERYHPHWLLLDPTLRVLATFPVVAGDAAIALLRSRLTQPFPDDAWAPVISVPNVLEVELCRELVSLYEANGGEESGFMRDVDGKTVRLVDHNHKRRRDYIIEDEQLQRKLGARLRRRLAPMLKRAMQFEPTRMERYLVACYEAGAGHFRPHRDDTTKGTAHRQFAVTINLNADEYEGGDLRFPEFGPRTYRAPTGGAIVFSCSLLHEATPVTSGRRYAFLPFLYNEAGAQLREGNNAYLGPGLSEYRRDR